MVMRSQLFMIFIFLMGHFETALAGSNSLNLEDFLKKVQTQSPEIQIEMSINEEFKAKAQGIRISPPMVGLMNMRDFGGNNRGIEITQELPFPTKISKEKEVRELEAKAQSSNFSYKKNEIFLEAKKVYFEFWKSFETKKVLDEKQAWLKKHVQLSRSVARSDSAGQIHLLASESELDQLDNEILEAQSDLIEKSNLLKTFVPDLQIESLTPEAWSKSTTISLQKSRKSLLVEAKENDLRAANSNRDLKKQSYLPDLVLRYRAYNGNDMTPRSEEVMVGVTLPFLFFWQPQAEVSEASARQQRAEAELLKARIGSESQLKSLIEKSKSLSKQLDNFKDKLIPRAHKRMKLVENLTVRTIEALDEHRMVMLDYLDLRQKEINAKVEFEKLNIEILKLTNTQED
ncbi:MAG: TolC family protein [Bdellovibrionaceae bacterium]|nr:TolC family protein [Pseudobdellovibrionaceae bacterium]